MLPSLIAHVGRSRVQKSGMGSARNEISTRKSLEKRMTYILILWLYGYGAKGVTAEFDTQAACMSAGAAVVAKVRNGMGGDFICAPKGSK